METNIAILGTGSVGKTIGSRLIQLGYLVMMGSRTAENENAVAWSQDNGGNAYNGTFAEAARFGNIIFNCTKGEITLDVFNLAGIENFSNKTVVDISNPLDFSHGMPPSLFKQWSNTNSLGEEIQKLLPEANVIKTLNMVNCDVMVDASRCGGEATMFIAGNNEGAKSSVIALLEKFGWNDIIDLGDITSARGMEMLLPIWLKTWKATGDGHFAFKIVRT